MGLSLLPVNKIQGKALACRKYGWAELLILFPPPLLRLLLSPPEEGNLSAKGMGQSSREIPVLATGPFWVSAPALPAAGTRVAQIRK